MISPKNTVNTGNIWQGFEVKGKPEASLRQFTASIAKQLLTVPSHILQALNLEKNEAKRAVAQGLSQPLLPMASELVSSTDEYTRVVKNLNKGIATEKIKELLTRLRDSIAMTQGEEEITNNTFCTEFKGAIFTITVGVKQDGSLKSVHVRDNKTKTQLKLPIDHWNTKFILDKKPPIGSYII